LAASGTAGQLFQIVTHHLIEAFAEFPRSFARTCRNLLGAKEARAIDKRPPNWKVGRLWNLRN
jgi:hypothetical protein